MPEEVIVTPSVLDFEWCQVQCGRRVIAGWCGMAADSEAFEASYWSRI
jgi:hypothetical protein